MYSSGRGTNRTAACSTHASHGGMRPRPTAVGAVTSPSRWQLVEHASGRLVRSTVQSCLREPAWQVVCEGLRVCAGIHVDTRVTWRGAGLHSDGFHATVVLIMHTCTHAVWAQLCPVTKAAHHEV